MRYWSIKCTGGRACVRASGVSQKRQRWSTATASLEMNGDGEIELRSDGLDSMCEACRSHLVYVVVADFVVLNRFVADLDRYLAGVQRATRVLTDLLAVYKALPYIEHRGEDIELYASGRVVPHATYDLVGDLRSVVRGVKSR